MPYWDCLANFWCVSPGFFFLYLQASRALELSPRLIIRLLCFVCLMGFTHSCMLSFITREPCRSAQRKMGGRCHAWQAKQAGGMHDLPLAFGYWVEYMHTSPSTCSIYPWFLVYCCYIKPFIRENQQVSQPLKTKLSWTRSCDRPMPN